MLIARPVMVISTKIPFQEKTYHVLRIVLETQWEGRLKLGSEHNAYCWLDSRKAGKSLSLVDGIKEILNKLDDGDNFTYRAFRYR